MNRADLARYRVEGYATPDTARGYDAESEADTLAEARKRARHMLSEDYRQLTEASGCLSLAVVRDTRDGSEAWWVERKPDPKVAAIARDLTRRGTGPGLYVNTGAGASYRATLARVALGYPTDGVELCDAYAVDPDSGEPVWHLLAYADRLLNQRGESIGNPLAALVPTP